MLRDFPGNRCIVFHSTPVAQSHTLLNFGCHHALLPTNNIRITYGGTTIAKKPYKKRRRPPKTRINERIRVPEIRVIYGEANAVMPTAKALAKAKELGLDLVEIAPNVKPPVCRIVDYGKWKYEQSKQKKNQKPSKQREKEVKFRVNIGEHDYNIKLTRAEDFLAAGYKVRIQLQFKGRQMAHKNLGFDLMNKVKEDLSGTANCDFEPKLTNRNIMMMLSPLPPERQVRKFRTEDEEVDLDAHEAAEAEESHDDDHDDDEHDDDISAEEEQGEEEDKS